MSKQRNSSRNSPGGRTGDSGAAAGSASDRQQRSRTAWLTENAPLWRFGLKFGVLMGAYYVLVLTPFFDGMLYRYLSASAWLANGALNWLGQDSHVAEITIRSARFAITVRRGCDAVEPSWFFCAALLAFPAPFARKLWGILAGAAILQALNLVRIVSLYFIGLHYPAAFGPFHLEVWPVVFVLTAVSLWLAWIGWTRRGAAPDSHATA